jgi:hypothetical protein
MTSISINDQDKALFAFGKTFLLQRMQRLTMLPERDCEKILELYLKPQQPTTLSGIFRRLVLHAQNRAGMTNVIKNSLPGKSIDSLASVLCKFDPHLVTAKFTDWKNLLQRIKSDLKPTGEIREGANSFWPQFCKSILSGAKFLATYPDAEVFYKWVDSFYTDPRLQSELPHLLAAKLDGFGFTLACDFLKELGFDEYAKPDRHLKNILVEAGACSLDNDSMVFDCARRIAKNSEVTPYTVDKVFFLIGSGYLYDHDLKLGRGAEDFISEYRQHMAHVPQP